MTDSIHSLVLILQGDAQFGHKISQHLYKDRHDVLGPVTKITSAYKILIDNLPDLAVIDSNICEDEIGRLSDTLILLGVPHIINHGQFLTLTKRIHVNGADVISKVNCAAPLEQSIAHTLWDMHIERVLFHWLDDAVKTESLAA